MKKHAHNKLSLEFIEQWCTIHDIEFLDDEYVSNKFKHHWRCIKHDEVHSQMFDKIRRKEQLKCCSEADKRARTKLEADSFAKDHNMTIVSEYTNTQQPIGWKCNKHGDIFHKSFFGMKRLKDKRLPCCQEEDSLTDARGVKKYYTKQVKEIAASFGYELVDPQYKGIVHPHNWFCAKHNQLRTTTFQSIKNGKKLRCCAGEDRSGKNHPNFNPDITNEQRIKDRRSDKNKQWSKQVRQRDLHECQICGHNKHCVAHHLDSYMAHPEQRYDINNGVTLCRKCHNEFHKIYGNGTNTKQQFTEFIWSKI